MQIGDIKVADSILTLELKVRFLEQLISSIIELNKDTLNYPPTKVQDEFTAKALKELQSKYPNMGIKKNS
mgnify:CR=1 FL=1